MAKKKIDFTMAKFRLSSEESVGIPPEVSAEIMRSQGFTKEADAFLREVQLDEEMYRTICRAESLHMHGLSKSARRVLDDFQTANGVKIIDMSSKNGIPDYVQIVQKRKYEAFGEEIDVTEEELLTSNIQLFLPYLEVEDILKLPPKLPTRTFFQGICNAREEERIKQAALLSGKYTPSEFGTKATLYMARFINRHRRNEQGHSYHLGEAYLLMEHGEKMQQAFTPDEVTQAMEKVGISGSRIANDLMAELERLRDARMKP